MEVPAPLPTATGVASDPRLRTPSASVQGVRKGQSTMDQGPTGEVERPPDPSFESILFDRPDPEGAAETLPPPEYFGDLHLHETVASITSGREVYNLAPIFYAPLRDVGTIRYRHDVFRDLEGTAARSIVESFARSMQAMRAHLARANKAHYRYEQERWVVDAAAIYCDAVAVLTRDLTGAEIHSRGLLAFRDYLERYTGSPEFTALRDDTRQLNADLAAVRYQLRIDGTRVTVSRYDGEPDYGAEVLQAFAKFKRGAGKEYRFQFSAGSEMNHIEAAIVERVARLFPDLFGSLDAYCARHREFPDPKIRRFDREVQFYIAYLEHVDRLRQAGLPFCYPEVSDHSKAIYGRGVFDLALAKRLVDAHATVVTNDFYLEAAERILVVSGPNQGGKTTFARTIGQLHHLARIGVPVPGVEARLYLVDQIFTHFEREEIVEDLTGKLEHDLHRMRQILEQATSDSLLLMNESFSSTTVADQLIISQEVLQAAIARGMLGVVVTFLDELASLHPSTVSMVSTVDPEEPARRTFKIVRRPADGLAYAVALAEKHRLTYEGVRARIGPCTSA